MRIIVKPILHIIDTLSKLHFQEKVAEDLWIEFEQFWESVYFELPKGSRLDSELSFDLVYLENPRDSLKLSFDLVVKKAAGHLERLKDIITH